MVELQGGDVRVIDDPSLLPRARHTLELLSTSRGFVTEINCQAVGIASAVLGGGRAKKEDSIDPSVGLVLHRKLGDRVALGEPLCTIHYNSEARAAEARALLAKSFTITESAPRKKALIHRVIASNS
jgi:thymidine phosphorylase